MYLSATTDVSEVEKDTGDSSNIYMTTTRPTVLKLKNMSFSIHEIFHINVEHRKTWAMAASLSNPTQPMCEQSVQSETIIYVGGWGNKCVRFFQLLVRENSVCTKSNL